jgi:murein DD-endopeptidase MepM/ murein hydrolase activator NlpD
MAPFIIKSAVCLIAFYGFYHLFLRKQKILLFNRFYLIFSLILSMAIPFIVIPVKAGFTITDSFELLNPSALQIDNSAPVYTEAVPHFSYMNVIVSFFILISLFLTVRFIVNLIKIAVKIAINGKVQNGKTTIVLIQETTLPYSFFRYIFLNRSDYEAGRIEPELILHEEAHSRQYHSIDILIIELLNIFLWFNPAIWLFRKEILLNHEYSADSRVLSCTDTTDYQLILLNVLLRNNSSFLVSNFKYSSIKKRLAMMTKNNPRNSAILRKITGIIFFLLTGAAITFSKERIVLPEIFTIQETTPVIKPGNEKPELWPVKMDENAKISREFGKYKRAKTMPAGVDSIVYHYGIDIEAKHGTEIISTAGGVVIEAQYDGGYGNTVIIDHGDGYKSKYAHLKDFIVKNGDTVTKGQTIGHLGSTGKSTGPHLHFEVISKGQRVNPLNYLK